MSASSSAQAEPSRSAGDASSTGARTGPSQYRDGTSATGSQRGPTRSDERSDVEMEDITPPPSDKGKAKEMPCSNSTERREDVWQDRINNNIPHRDLRFNQTNLPPAGLGLSDMLNASMRRRPPAPPPTDSGDEEEDEEENDNPPLSSSEVKLPMNYRKEEYDGMNELDDDDNTNFITREEVLVICDSIREDMNSGFNRIIERMDGRRGSASKTKTPLTPRKSKSGKKISTLPSRRPIPRIENSRIVRDHLTTLVGAERLLIPLVTADEAAAFETRWTESGSNPREHCCTAEAFRFDIMGTPKTPWNISAARVFYHSLVPAAERSTAKCKEITDAFHTRIKSLRRDYKTRRDASQLRIKKRDDRRRARKHYLFQRRLAIAVAVPELNQHCGMLEELTVAGMSSDESDSERIASDPALRNEMPKYEVTAPAWRHPRLHGWLRVFDTLHIAGRRSNGPSVGEWPHNRFRHSIAPKPSSSMRFVSGLPIDTYNDAWLGTRHDIDFVVQPLDQEYDFTHDDAIYSYLGQSNTTRAGPSGHR